MQIKKGFFMQRKTKAFLIKIIAIGAILCLFAFVLTGCGGSVDNGAATGLQNASSAKIKIPDDYNIVKDAIGNEYGFKLNGHRFSTSGSTSREAQKNGNSVIVISYSFFNNSDRPTSRFALNIEAWQGASSLKSDIGWLPDDDPYVYGNSKEINPGQAQENVEMFFTLLDNGTDVELKIKPDVVSIPRDGEIYTVTIPLGGETTIKDTQATITEPNFANFFRVDVQGVRLTKDFLSGDDVVVVKFAFANLSPTGTDYPPCVLKYSLLQNGTPLERAYFIKDSAVGLQNLARLLKSGYMFEEVEVGFKLKDLKTDLVFESSEHIEGTLVPKGTKLTESLKLP